MFLEAEIEDLATFREVGLAINSILDFQEMLACILRVVSGKVETNMAAIYLYDRRSDCFEARMALRGGEIVPGRRFRRKLLRPERVRSLPATALVHDAGGRDHLLSPLIAKGEAIGALLLEEPKGRAFTERDRRLVDLLSKEIALAVNNSLLYDLAITDGLTGLYVHRHFQMKLAEEFSRFLRYETPLSLAVADIDHFKTFNDTYGHTVGDAVLRETAAIFRNSVRTTDSVYRYGGEEITFLFPETGPDDAFRIAEKLRVAVENHRFAGGRQLQVTVSLGVAAADRSQRSPSELVEAADRALYRAKAEGRNCVSAASAEAATPAPAETAEGEQERETVRSGA
jgi:diguanylate cyclase (GGDEF)-like protein